MDLMNLYPNSSVMPSEEEMLLAEIKKRMMASEPDRSPAALSAAALPVKPDPNVLPALPKDRRTIREAQAQSETKTIENLIAPVRKEHRIELQSELNSNRGVPANPKQNPSEPQQLYSFVAQKEGLDDLKARIQEAMNLQPKPNWTIPIITAAQFLNSKSGDASALITGQKLIEEDNARQEKLRQDLLEKLYTLKQKQEQGIAASDMNYLRAMIPQAIAGSTATSIKSGYTDKLPPDKSSQEGLQLSRLMREFKNDPDVKSSLKSLEDMRVFQTGVEKPNWLTDVTARAALTTAAKLYPVSDRDVQYFSGSQEILQKAQRGWNKIMSGEMYTEQDRKDIEAYVTFRKSVEAKRLSSLEEHYAKNIAPVYGFSYEDALSKIRPSGGRENLGYSNQPRPQTPSQPKQSPQGMVRVRKKETGESGLIASDKLESALKSGKYEEVK